jgi:hypothetical protein
MKKYPKSRGDERFLVGAHQNPSVTVGRLSQWIATVEKLVAGRIIASETMTPDEKLGPGDGTTRSLSTLKIAVQRPISNRHCGRLEIAATQSKQTTAPISNRHFFAPAAHKIHASPALRGSGNKRHNGSAASPVGQLKRALHRHTNHQGSARFSVKIQQVWELLGSAAGICNESWAGPSNR